MKHINTAMLQLLKPAHMENSWFANVMGRRAATAQINYILSSEEPHNVGVCGTMFAGKTTLLIDVATTLDADKRVLLVKHKDDTRYSIDHVTTHDGEETALATLVAGSCDEIVAKVKETDSDLVIVDELHFFGKPDEMVKCVSDLNDEGVSILYTFPKSEYGTAAEFWRAIMVAPGWERRHIFELNACCFGCDSLATHTIRFVDAPADPTIPINWLGGFDKYAALCDKCDKEWKDKKIDIFYSKMVPNQEEHTTTL